MDIELLIANVICFAGTMLCVKDVIKNREILKGYPLLGSLLTATAIVMFNHVFLRWNELLSVLFGSPTAIYWILVCVFLIKERLK